MIQVSFFQARDNDEELFLFSEGLKTVPAVGDTISYSFQPYDREKWNPESLQAGDTAHRAVRDSRVVKVTHLIRRINIASEASHVACVYLEPEK